MLKIISDICGLGIFSFYFRRRDGLANSMLEFDQERKNNELLCINLKPKVARHSLSWSLWVHAELNHDAAIYF
jgi:hypothetical protein